MPERFGNCFRNLVMVRSIYERANERSPDDPMLIQQEAIFEMTSPDGSLHKASELLAHAHRLAPTNQPIAHSLAELSLRKADRATTKVERRKLQKESRELATEVALRVKHDSHPHHTLIKVGLSELEDILEEGSESAIEVKIRDFRKRSLQPCNCFRKKALFLRRTLVSII